MRRAVSKGGERESAPASLNALSKGLDLHSLGFRSGFALLVNFMKRGVRARQSETESASTFLTVLEKEGFGLAQSGL